MKPEQIDITPLHHRSTMTYRAIGNISSDYYPFGMLMPGRNASSASYRYGFNGKEKDDEVSGNGNQYDYGFRIYNPRIARFLSVDPLTSSYPWYTPYQFAGNKPIWAIDLDGLEEYYYIDYWVGRNGKVKITTRTRGVLEEGGATRYVLRLIDLSKEELVIEEKNVPRKQFYETAEYLGVRENLNSRSLNEYIKDNYGDKDSQPISEKTDIPASEQSPSLFDKVFGGNFGVQKGKGGGTSKNGSDKSSDGPLFGTSPQEYQLDENSYHKGDSGTYSVSDKSNISYKIESKWVDGEWQYSHEFYEIDKETNDTTWQLTDDNIK